MDGIGLENSLEENAIKLCVEASSQKHNQMFGIGVIAYDLNNKAIHSWALKESSSGDFLQDQAKAVKLATNKASMKQWRRIRVEVPSKGILQLLRLKSAKDIRLFALMEDIHSLSLLFLKCSFCLLSQENRYRNNMVCSYTLNIVQDKKWDNSQY